MLRVYRFMKEFDAILLWGGSVVAFMIAGWAGVAWWLLILIAPVSWAIAWTFFRAFFWPTPEMKKAGTFLHEQQKEQERRSAELPCNSR